ncbi:MAG: septum formation initiator family protein [Acidobacteriota bacterium]|nr:septum formation initiator family protein [Acidobacteriota bacterium]
MNKVATTYWDDSNTVFIPTTKNTRSRVRPSAAGGAKREKANSWLGFAVVVALSSMICLTVNLRAYSELSAERDQHQFLNAEVDQLTIENSTLQEEIKQIKTDSLMIEREARRLGMSRPNEKVLVPAN